VVYVSHATVVRRRVWHRCDKTYGTTLYIVHVRREASIQRPGRPAKYGAEIIWLAHCMQSVLFSVNEKTAEKRKQTDLSLTDKVKVVKMLGDKLSQRDSY